MANFTELEHIYKLQTEIGQHLFIVSWLCRWNYTFATGQHILVYSLSTNHDSRFALIPHILI